MRHDARFRRAALLAVAGLVASFAPHALAAAGAGEREGSEVRLRWALGALDSGSSKPTAIQRDTQLDTRTKLKLLIEPLSPGSVYLLLLDSSQELQVLYEKASTVRTAEGSPPTYIPPGSQWFALEDGAGVDTFFLLASVKPLEDLEKLLARHKAADATARKAIVTAVVEEVRRLNKAYRDFARPAERPVMIGGQTRGTTTSSAAIDQLAVEVEAEQFYGKTITIDH